jgi:asparagine synthase (glutamine-hydrolysing)
VSGFAVIYERSNTPVNPGVLERVMDRLEHRGPDGSDHCVTGHIAMGHWHFWTTPEEVGERQPLQIADLPFKIVLDGRLDNRIDLTNELNLDFTQGSSLSDAALILRAYDRWGEHCFEHFIGEYALVIFDEKRSELICARDALGDRTLFYSFKGTRVVIASEPWAVAGADDSRIELDESAIAHYFALESAADGQTLFKNIYELLPAHVMILNDTGERKWRHWQPDLSRPLRGLSDQEYAEQFLHLLEQSVRCRMRSTTPVGVLMSGGLDSTSVASLAARMIAPEALTTISYVFDELPECDERKYINAMVERWGIHSIQILCDDAWPYKDWQNWPRNPNEPEGNPYRLLKERAYEKARQTGLRVLLTGGFGDHLYDGAEDWLADLMSEGRFHTVFQEMAFYLRHAGWRWTLDEGFIQSAVRRLLNAFPGRKHAHHKRAMPAWLSFLATGFLYPGESNHGPDLKSKGNLLGMQAAWDCSSEIYNASRYEIELRHPYRDRRLIEFILAIPAYQLYYRGLYKWILRNAMRGILPEVIRTRLYPTSIVALNNRGMERERAVRQALLKDPNANGYEYISRDWLLKHWDVPILPDMDGPAALIPWLFFAFESWYKKRLLSN